MIILTKEMKSGAILKKEKQTGYKPDTCVCCSSNCDLQNAYSD